MAELVLDGLDDQLRGPVIVILILFLLSFALLDALLNHFKYFLRIVLVPHCEGEPLEVIRLV